MALYKGRNEIILTDIQRKTERAVPGHRSLKIHKYFKYWSQFEHLCTSHPLKPQWTSRSLFSSRESRAIHRIPWSLRCLLDPPGHSFCSWPLTLLQQPLRLSCTSPQKSLNLNWGCYMGRSCWWLWGCVDFGLQTGLCLVQAPGPSIW